MKIEPKQIWKDTLSGRKVRVLNNSSLVVEYEYLRNRVQNGRKGRKASLFTNDFIERFKYLR